MQFRSLGSGGQTLLFIASPGADGWAVFAGPATHLAIQGYRCLVPDTSQADAQSIARWLEELGVSRLTVVGGGLAVEVAALLGHQRARVCTGSAIDPSADPVAFTRALVAELNGSAGHGETGRILREWFNEADRF